MKSSGTSDKRLENKQKEKNRRSARAFLPKANLLN